MIAGLEANNANFLAGLSNIEDRISKINEQITSGFRVNQASDDPSAVAPILQYQGQIDHLTQVQSNLNIAQTNAQTADSALQTASKLMDQLVAYASQGASSTSDSTSRTILGQKVQQVLDQLVSVANTSVAGHYLFGGDNDSQPPYKFDWANGGAVATSSAPSKNSTILRDGDGNQINPNMTASDIFDSSDGSIFKAAFNLGTALLNNNPTGTAAAMDSVKAGVTQLGQITTTYGNVQSWIQQASDMATSHLSSLTTALGNLKDTDMTTAITQLTSSQTAMQAAIAAHGALNTKSLFSYMG